MCAAELCPSSTSRSCTHKVGGNRLLARARPHLVSANTPMFAGTGKPVHLVANNIVSVATCVFMYRYRVMPDTRGIFVIEMHMYSSVSDQSYVDERER